MILSHSQLEEIAAAVTEDFNFFHYGNDVTDEQLMRSVPIDLFVVKYLGFRVSYIRLSLDGNICGLTAYACNHTLV